MRPTNMRLIALLLVATAALSASGQAQTPAAPPSGQQAQPPTSPVQAPPPIDSSRLGVSFDRIKRELAQSRAEDEQIRDGSVKLSFSVQVVGQAPRVVALHLGKLIAIDREVVRLATRLPLPKRKQRQQQQRQC